MHNPIIIEFMISLTFIKEEFILLFVKNEFFNPFCENKFINLN